MYLLQTKIKKTHIQSSHLHLCLSVIFAMPLSMTCLSSPLYWTFSLLLQLFCHTFFHPLKSGRHSPLHLFHASNCSKQSSQSIWTPALSWFLLLVPSLFHLLTFQSHTPLISLLPSFSSRFQSICLPFSFTAINTYDSVICICQSSLRFLPDFICQFLCHYIPQEEACTQSSNALSTPPCINSVTPYVRLLSSIYCITSSDIRHVSSQMT